MTAVSVEEATEVTPALLEALARLVPQLSQSAAPIGEAELAEMVASPTTRLLVARLPDETGEGHPPTKGNAGGKLPRGKGAARSPARSFSAAERNSSTNQA